MKTAYYRPFQKFVKTQATSLIGSRQRKNEREAMRRIRAALKCERESERVSGGEREKKREEEGASQFSFDFHLNMWHSSDRARKENKVHF